jgi:epoxyqueuosine reductase
MAISSEKSLSILIKENVRKQGFDLCGIAPSRPLEEHAATIKEWCSSGMNGAMSYLGRNIEKRIDPGLLFPGTKSVIVTGLNYYTDKKQGGNGIPVISRYAYGTNYHDVIKSKLNKVLEYIKRISPEAEGKTFVDFSPILEKAWAREAGIGWPGRHSILINKEIGSFFFLGIILLDQELNYDKPFSEDHCTNCRLCMESCPTQAINENRTIDVRKCIAYLTIEAKEPVPEELAVKMEGRVFGCDRCQEVCPWNAKARPNRIPGFQLSVELERMTEEGWINLSGEQFSRLFKKSAIARRTYDWFMKNVTNVTGKSEV